MSDASAYRRLAGSRGRRRARALPLTILTNPGLWILESHRIANYLKRRPQSGGLRWWLARIAQPLAEYLTAVCTKSEMLAECDIESDVYLSNGGHIICGAHSIGSGTVIHDHCTLGGNVADGRGGRPTIGRNVWIGPNCIIAGELTVGDGATILPGSFVTFSVGPGAIVKGNPARVIAETHDNTAIRGSLEVIDAVDAR